MAVPVSELQAVAPSAIIELFELQLNVTQHGVGDLYRFHAGTNLNASGALVWNGNTYQRFPIEADGFEYSGNGQLPRPKIRVSNILSTITAILLTLPEGLEGAKVTRIRTLARYIDAVNFPGSVNPYGTPDPTAEFPREIYYVDRKTVENRDVIEFELAAAFDLAGVRAPKRQCIANICQWVYRSAECSYTGIPVADADDKPLPPLTSSAEAIAYYAAKDTLTAATATRNSARTALNTAKNNLNAAQGTWVLVSEQFVAPLFGVMSYGVTKTATGSLLSAKWNSTSVALGTTYRIGTFQYRLAIIDYYAIQQWSLDNSAVVAAQSAYNSALSTYNSALSAYNSAVSAANSTYATWLASPSYASDLAASGDVCGKRLSSCKLRFGSNAQLPFGSFPGVGTYFT